MRAAMTFLLLSLAAAVAAPDRLWAQGGGSAQTPSLESVIRQQREYEARQSAKIAPAVKKQLEINHRDDPGLAKEMFDAWKIATNVSGHVEESAARAAAARNAATDPAERRERNEELRDKLNTKRQVDATLRPVIEDVERLVADDPEVSAAHRKHRQVLDALDYAARRNQPGAEGNRGVLELPQESDLLQLFNGPDSRMDRVRLNVDDLIIMEALDDISQTIEAAAASDLNRGTDPGTLPGTDPERFVQASQDRWDSAPRVDSAGQQALEAPSPQRVAEILRELSAVQSQIADHNQRVPKVARTQEEYDFWNGQASRLNSAQDALLAELDAAD